MDVEATLKDIDNLSDSMVEVLKVAQNYIS